MRWGRRLIFGVRGEGVGLLSGGLILGVKNKSRNVWAYTPGHRVKIHVNKC